MLDLNDIAIEKLIPQREPICMVNKLKEHDERKSVSIFRVPEQHLFVSDNKFQAPGLVENIAQTAAARAGYAAFLSGETPKIGFIGAISQLEIHQLPAVGKTLETVVEEVMAFMNVSVVKGQSTCDGELVASCELKIFLQENA